jgi:hypothetical protein
MGMLRVDVYSVGILCMGIESLDVAVVSLHKTWLSLSSKKIIFDTYLLKCQFYLVYILLNHFMN